MNYRIKIILISLICCVNYPAIPATYWNGNRVGDDFAGHWHVYEGVALVRAPHMQVGILSEFMLSTEIAVVGRFIAYAPNENRPIDYPEEAILMQFQVDDIIRGADVGATILVRVPKRDFHRPEYDISRTKLFESTGYGGDFSRIESYFDWQRVNNAAVKLGDSYLVFARKHPTGQYYEFPFEGKWILSKVQYEAMKLDFLRSFAAGQEWRDYLAKPHVQERRRNLLEMERALDADGSVRTEFYNPGIE